MNNINNEPKQNQKKEEKKKSNISEENIESANVFIRWACRIFQRIFELRTHECDCFCYSVDFSSNSNRAMAEQHFQPEADPCLEECKCYARRVGRPNTDTHGVNM